MRAERPRRLRRVSPATRFARESEWPADCGHEESVLMGGSVDVQGVEDGRTLASPVVNAGDAGDDENESNKRVS